MFAIDLIFALIVAILMTVLLVAAAGWRHPTRQGGGGLFIIFLVIFLVAWAGGVWIRPFGPVLWGGYWLPFLVVGLLIALILAAAVPPQRRRRRGPQPATGTSQALQEGEEDAGPTATLFGVFFWVLLIVAVVAVIIAFLR